MAERLVKTATGTAKVRRCVACNRTEAGDVQLEWRRLGDGTQELLCVDPLTCRLTYAKNERES